MLPILLLLFFVCIFSCGKDGVFDQYGNYGEGSAQLNGVPFEGSVGTYGANNYCPPDTCVTIKIVYKNKEGFNRGDITIERVQLKTGKFQIYFSPKFPFEKGNYAITYSEQTDDGDVFSALYQTYQADTSNWVNIKKLNLKSGDIEGAFQATVIRNKVWVLPGGIQDTIKISDGKFFGKINWSL